MYFQKRACQNIQKLSKQTFLALVEDRDYKEKSGADQYRPSSTKAFFDNLINKSIPWNIVSFNPDTQTVCVFVDNIKGTQYITVKVKIPYQ
jgi:hypothetical protein